MMEFLRILPKEILTESREQTKALDNLIRYILHHFRGYGWLTSI